MRWGFPPAQKIGIGPVTNGRNTKSAFWRPWLTPAYRCLVPATSFCEYTDILSGSTMVVCKIEKLGKRLARGQHFEEPHSVTVSSWHLGSLMVVDRVGSPL